MNYTLHLGDCLEVMPGIPGGSVDAIIADWPYGQTACKWDSVIPLEPLWRECKRVIKAGGAIVLFGNQPFTSSLVMSNLDWFKWADVWEKSKPVGFLDANRRPLRSHEDILVFCDGSPTYNPQKWQIDPRFMDRRKTYNINLDEGSVYGKRKAKTKNRDDGTRYPISIISIATEWRKSLNLTPKPVALMEYLIRTYTNPGDLVLDNTMGSGSTGEACLRTGRRFIGIEKDPGYFNIAQARLERVEQDLKEAQIAREQQPYLMAEARV